MTLPSLGFICVEVLGLLVWFCGAADERKGDQIAKKQKVIGITMPKQTKARTHDVRADPCRVEFTVI